MTAFAQLRQVVLDMPEGLAAAMLEGVQRSRIIGGRYVEPGGDGLCPMTAAFRAGMPRQHTAPFAQAWDRYLQLRRGIGGHITEVRPATRRELAVLVSLLRERLFGAEAVMPVSGEHRCPGCGRAERIDLRGDCVFCATPLVAAAPGPSHAGDRSGPAQLVAAPA